MFKMGGAARETSMMKSAGILEVGVVSFSPALGKIPTTRGNNSWGFEERRGQGVSLNISQIKDRRIQPILSHTLQMDFSLGPRPGVSHLH